MRTFSENVMWQQSLSTRLFDVAQGSSIGFNVFWMPLSNSIMNRIWPKEIRTTVFHVTNELGYRSIKKMQGRRSSISAFFEMRGNYFEQGIQTSGGVIIELDANILGAFNQDVMSAPDTSGRRWIQLEFMKGRFGEKDLSKYQKGLQDLVGNLLKKYWQKVMNVSSTPRFQKGRYYIHWMNLGMKARENDKKTLHLIIKEYMDGVEAIYKKNATHLRGLLTNYLKLRRTEEAWDEVIANNFKIKKVWILPDSRNWGGEINAYGLNEIDAFKEEVEGDGFPVQETSKMEMETYTRGIAKKFAAEEITLPIEVGTELLGGRFKNKKITVKDIGRNEKGDITINGRPLLKYRIA